MFSMHAYYVKENRSLSTLFLHIIIFGDLALFVYIDHAPGPWTEKLNEYHVYKLR